MQVQVDFDSFSFDQRLLRTLRDSGILAPTTIQRAAFPPLMQGRDLALQTGGGTGRTLAWCLPVLHRHLAVEDRKRIIVLAPSGDKAMRIEAELKMAGRRLDLTILMPAAGVEQTGARYEMFDGKEDLPDILVGLAASVLHFIEGTSYPLDEVGALIIDRTASVDDAMTDATRRIARQLPETCQRVVLTEGGDEMADVLGWGVLRSPSIVTGTSSPPASDERVAEGTRPEDSPQDERDEEEEETPLVRPQTRRSHSPPPGKPEHWPIRHVGVTVAGRFGPDEIARVLRAEMRGHTVVLGGSEEQARVLAEQLAERLDDTDVRWVSEHAELPEDQDEGVTVVSGASRRREGLTANVLLLDSFPRSPDDYVTHIPMMRCEPGDRIVSMITPLDVSHQYQLRLSYGIRLLERRVPTLGEIESNEQAARLRALVDLASKAGDGDMDLLRRVQTMEQGEAILAVALARLLAGESGGELPVSNAKRSRRRSNRSRERASRHAEKQPEPEPAAPIIRSEGVRHMERSASRRGGTPMIELLLDCGEELGVEAEYISHWLQSRLAMSPSDIGAISVEPRRCVVTVPRERAGEAAMMLRELEFGDHRVNVTDPTELPED